MKRLLITGASGFLGRRAAAFYSETCEICAPSRTELDITDLENVYAVFRRFKPHCVIHCAAVSDLGMCEKDPEGSWRINVDGSRNMAAAAAEFSAKCLLCGSDQVYFGNGIKGPHREDEPIAPPTVYGREKKAAEEECLAVNPDCVILRLTWMYDTCTLAPQEHGDFFRTLADRLRTSAPLSYPVYDIRGITDVNEVIRNFKSALELNGGIYNFGSPNHRNTYETVRAMFTALGWDPRSLTKNEEAFAADPRDISMDTGKLNDSGITFSSTLDALARNGRMLRS
nr:sugar nucleotide-binding protein [uncultured Schaedlerella sp.]